MTRRIVALLAGLFLLIAVAPVFSQTEDEIISQYLKKTEKKQKVQGSAKVGFFSFSLSYGKLPNENPYNSFYKYANANITNLGGPEWPLLGIWRSKQFGASFGMMASRRVGVKVGFDYWLKMGSRTQGDFEFDMQPLGVQNDFDLVSEVKVFGVKAGFDYYIYNKPDKMGVINSLSFRLGFEGGYYFSNWDIWQGSSSYNLATQTYDANTSAMEGNAAGFAVSIGADYPIRFFGLLVGVDASYIFLNFKNVHGYNNVGEELYLTYSDNNDDRVNLDFSGPRAQIQLKRFFHW